MNKLHKLYNEIKKIPKKSKPTSGTVITEERKVEIKPKK